MLAFTNDYVELASALLVVLIPLLFTNLHLKRIGKENKAQHGGVEQALRQFAQTMKESTAANRTEHLRMMDGLPSPMFRADGTGRCTWVNRAWLQATGMTWAEAIGDGWAHAIHAEDRDEVRAVWREAVRRGGDFGPMTYRYGSKVYEVHALPVTHPDASIEYVGIAHEVTVTRSDEAAA